MKKRKYHLYLTDEEHSLLMKCLIESKNARIQQGKYTDAVDEVLYKIVTIKPKKYKIKYI